MSATKEHFFFFVCNPELFTRLAQDHWHTGCAVTFQNTAWLSVEDLERWKKCADFFKMDETLKRDTLAYARSQYLHFRETGEYREVGGGREFKDVKDSLIETKVPPHEVYIEEFLQLCC